MKDADSNELVRSREVRPPPTSDADDGDALEAVRGDSLDGLLLVVDDVGAWVVVCGRDSFDDEDEDRFLESAIGATTTMCGELPSLFRWDTKRSITSATRAPVDFLASRADNEEKLGLFSEFKVSKPEREREREREKGRDT